MSLITLGAVLVTSGCGLAAPPGSASQAPSTLGPRASVPAAPATLPQARTPGPSAAPASIQPVPTTAPPADAPPLGLLDAGDGPAEGWLGSYCWQELCADVPAIPGKNRLPEVAFGTEGLTLTLTGGSTFVSWHASYGTSGNQLQPLAQGGADFDPDAVTSTAPPQLTSATFAPPPDGDWVLTVQVFFTDGDAMYAWHAVSD